jgi:hypothetical protein
MISKPRRRRATIPAIRVLPETRAALKEVIEESGQYASLWQLKARIAAVRRPTMIKRAIRHYRGRCKKRALGYRCHGRNWWRECE